MRAPAAARCRFLVLGAAAARCRPLAFGAAAARCGLLVFGAAVALAGCSASTGRTPLAFPNARHVPPPDVPVVATAPGVADAVTRSALDLTGIRYQFGGEDPATGVDCSGLVRFVFLQHQVALPRTVAEQYGVGQRVRLDEVRAGDLLFFTTTGPGATHVGIALGPSAPGQFVHAPGTGSVVRVERYDTSYWADRFLGARRVVG